VLGLQPIELFSANDFRQIDSWSIPSGTPKTIAFVLTKTDSLGTRRYIPATGSTVQLKVMRARAATSNSQAETITKTCVPRPEDKSMFEVSLTADDTKKMLSGGIQLVVTESGLVSSVNIPYVVKKVYSDPGF
jgi:hypothetical protein